MHHGTFMLVINSLEVEVTYLINSFLFLSCGINQEIDLSAAILNS